METLSIHSIRESMYDGSRTRDYKEPLRELRLFCPNSELHPYDSRKKVLYDPVVAAKLCFYTLTNPRLLGNRALRKEIALRYLFEFRAMEPYKAYFVPVPLCTNCLRELKVNEPMQHQGSCYLCEEEAPDGVTSALRLCHTYFNPTFNRSIP